MGGGWRNAQMNDVINALENNGVGIVADTVIYFIFLWVKYKWKK